MFKGIEIWGGVAIVIALMMAAAIGATSKDNQSKLGECYSLVATMKSLEVKDYYCFQRGSREYCVARTK